MFCEGGSELAGPYFFVCVFSVCLCACETRRTVDDVLRL